MPLNTARYSRLAREIVSKVDVIRFFTRLSSTEVRAAAFGAAQRFRRYNNVAVRGIDFDFHSATALV